MPAGRASPAGPAWPRDSQPCSQPGLASTQPGLACGRLASRLTACWARWRACGFERSDFLKLTIQFPIQFFDPFFLRHLRSETTKNIGSEKWITNWITIFGPLFRSNFSIQFYDPIFRSNFTIQFFDPIFRSNLSIQFFDPIFAASQLADLPHSQPAGQQAGKAAAHSQPAASGPASWLASWPPSLPFQPSKQFCISGKPSKRQASIN